MHLKFRNVNDAFRGLVDGIHSGAIPSEVMASRYGEVAAIEEPVTLTYNHPNEKVLFNQARDVNPFSLLYEALWTLAGRNDVAPLAYYTKRMAEFSDDGETWNDAYGYRWRHTYQGGYPHNSYPRQEEDQLKVIIDHLRRKPESRRAVLQMWNVEDDLLKMDTSKAICCNLSVLFSVEKGMCPNCNGKGAPCLCTKCNGKPHDQPRYLNMTVFNRSNDIVWGTLGANYVTFSVLLEYVAAHLGLEVGKYHQISNNLHCYTNNWQPEAWLAGYGLEGYDRFANYPGQVGAPDNECKMVPLVHDPKTFDAELPLFVERHQSIYHRRLLNTWQEPFLSSVAHPMLQAFHYRKDEPETAAEWASKIKADDWRLVTQAWLQRRQARKEAKCGASQEQT